LTKEERDVFDAIKGGADTVVRVALDVRRRKQDVCRIVDSLEKSEIISTRPLRTGTGKKRKSP
jgi:hypothetical protein